MTIELDDIDLNTAMRRSLKTRKGMGLRADGLHLLAARPRVDDLSSLKLASTFLTYKVRTTPATSQDVMRIK